MPCKCGSEDAEYVVNPYASELFDIELYEWLCADCYQEAIWDI